MRRNPFQTVRSAICLDGTQQKRRFIWLNPPNSRGKDYNTWDWGGNLIVHEIVQRPDGTLSVKVPETVDADLKNRCP